MLGYTICAELGDISRFPSPKRLCAYTALCPKAYQSGGSPLNETPAAADHPSQDENGAPDTQGSDFADQRGTPPGYVRALIEAGGAINSNWMLSATEPAPPEPTQPGDGVRPMHIRRGSGRGGAT